MRRRRTSIEEASARLDALANGTAFDDDARARRWPPAEREINQGIYDRHWANPSASTLIVTRLEWQLLKAANGIVMNPCDETKAKLLGKPVVILEDGEMSW